MRVFDVPQKYADLADELTVVIMSGEAPSEDLLGRLEDFKNDGPTAINQWCDTILEVEAAMDAIDERKRTLDSKKAALRKCKEYMRLALGNVLDTTFEGKFTSAERSAFTSDKKELVVTVENPESLPEMYQRKKIEAKIQDIKDAYRDGVTVPGSTVEEVTNHIITIR